MGRANVSGSPLGCRCGRHRSRSEKRLRSRKSQRLQIGCRSTRSGTLPVLPRRDRVLIPNTPEGPARARRYVNDTLSESPRDVVDVVSLLVSELATNCVQYASGDFTVSIEQSPDEVRVDVADEDEHPVTMREARPTDVTGRGLHIVEKMADDWGVRELKD